jgi:signal peptidase I
VTAYLSAVTPYLIATVSAVIGAAIGWLRWRLRIVTVIGDSMLPTLAPGDRLLVRRTPLARVRGGDLVVLAYPDSRGSPIDRHRGDDWLIKRAVATPGEPVPASVAEVLSVRPGSPVRDGALIAIGDNPDVSFDSRAFGYVFADDLLGVVLRPIRTGARRHRA